MKGPSGRALSVLAAGFLIFLLSFFFEPRKTTYSCKTVSSCLGLSTRHGYVHQFPKGEPVVLESLLQDGTLRFERSIVGADPDLLFLVLTKDATSWSKDFRSQQRNVFDFLDLLVSTKLDLGQTSLALLTTSKDEYLKLTSAGEKFPMARVVIFYKPEETGSTFPYEQRHNPTVQLARRSAIATLRNYLMLRGLNDEQHMIWIDADVVEFSSNLVQTMMGHSKSNKDAGIITARCYQHLMDNYDKNAWKVQSPQLQGIVQDTDRDKAVETLVAERLSIPALLTGTSDSDVVPLDSVGGTVLYIRAGLVRQGIVFPTFNIVGTEWSQFGWIGVETEGICYAAKSVQGGGCFVLGGSHYVRHSDLG